MLKFYRVPNSHCVIIERLGKYARTQKAGLRCYVRGLERIKRLDIEGSHWGDVANKENFFVELSEQNTNTRGSKAYTKDNVEITVDASIFWQIVDPQKAVYESDCLPLAIRDRTLGVLRASIGMFEFDELSTKREQLSRDTTDALIESGRKWGVKFTRVEIQQLLTDGKTHEALLQQVEADRRKKAIIAEAEGTSEQIRLNADARKIEALKAAEAQEQVMVLVAKGKKEAIELESEGKAKEILNLARAQADALALTKFAEREYLLDLTQIVGPTEAVRLLLADKYLKGFDAISKNPGDKVFLPNSFNGAFNLNLDGHPSTGYPKDKGAVVPAEVPPPLSREDLPKRLSRSNQAADILRPRADAVDLSTSSGKDTYPNPSLAPVPVSNPGPFSEWTSIAPIVVPPDQDQASLDSDFLTSRKENDLSETEAPSIELGGVPPAAGQEQERSV